MQIIKNDKKNHVGQIIITNNAYIKILNIKWIILKLNTI